MLEVDIPDPEEDDGDELLDDSPGKDDDRPEVGEEVVELIPEDKSVDEFLSDILEDSSEEVTEDIEKSGASISLSNFEKNIVHIAGRDMYIYNFKEQGIKLSPLTSVDAEKITKVYLPIPEHAEAIERLEKNRILIISGQPHSGKYATTLKLAMELAAKHFGMSLDIFSDDEVIDVPVQILRFAEDASLVDFLEDANCPSNRVFIVHDSFVIPGLGIAELQRHLTYIGLLLKKMNSFAILTSDQEYLKGAELSEQYRIGISGLDQTGLADVLTTHLEYYSVTIDPKDIPKPFKEKIASILGSAYSIDRFAANLAREKNLDRLQIENVLTKTANVGLDAKLWFNDLDPNEQYYAMFIGLCPELEKDKLWELYDRLVSALRAKKVSLKDAFNYPEGRLMERTNSHLTDVNSLEFHSPVYRDYVLEQIRSSYSQQFKYLSTLIADLTIANEDVKDTRIALASALGEIGKSSWKNYVTIITKWSSSPSKGIRSAVAHSLRQAATGIPQRKEITALLRKWSASPYPSIRWTVAASCERLYPFLPEFSLKVLEDLASDGDKTVRSAVAHAITTISKRDLEFVLDLILDWVVGESVSKRSTATNTFWRLMATSNRLNMLLKDDTTKLKVLPILADSCVAGGLFLQESLNCLKTWIPFLDAMKLPNVEKSLLGAYQAATISNRETILAQLKNTWLTSDDEAIQKFAIVMVYLMEQQDHVETAPDLGSESAPFSTSMKFDLSGSDASLSDREIPTDSNTDNSAGSGLKGTALDAIKK